MIERAPNLSVARHCQRHRIIAFGCATRGSVVWPRRPEWTTKTMARVLVRQW